MREKLYLCSRKDLQRIVLTKKQIINPYY